MLKRLFFLAVFFCMVPLASAQEMSNPEAVSYLHAEVTKTGYVYLFDNSPFQTARELKVTLAVPQNTSRQASFIKSVTGPDRYFLTEDEWGNRMVALFWDAPDLKERLHYTVVSDVEVWEKEIPAKNTRLPETDFTAPNPAIMQKTYETTYGLDDMQRLFSLTEWVYGNMRYDDSAKGFAQSAAWTYQNRRGTCDEFSNLLVAMLRVLGYSPRYVVGYAYSENWGQHGWVEVDYGGKTVSLDPTWLESPADSTHIKLADLPDSNFTEHVEVKGGQITIDWNKEEARVNVISFRQSPRISIGASLIPESSGDGSYALLKAEFAADGCILSKVNAKGCVNQEGHSFLSLSGSNQTLAFCGRQEAYWFLKSPEIKAGMVYTCPVVVYGGGAEKTVTLTTESGASKRLRTSVSSPNVFTPGQGFNLTSVTENFGYSTESAGVYVFFQGLVQEKNLELAPGGVATITWPLKAPSSPGEYEIKVFSSFGELATQKLTVIQQRRAEIERVSAPGSSYLKEALRVNVTIKALKDFSGVLKMSIDDYVETRQISIGPSESRALELLHVPESAGRKTIGITLISESGQYEDGWWGTLEVGEQRQWWGLMEWLQGFFGWLASLFSGGK